tara:strand:+ start:380 stop:817 length:438 start_codon:yes stop_codon:yes gene_type:complete
MNEKELRRIIRSEVKALREARVSTAASDPPEPETMVATRDAGVAASHKEYLVDIADELAVEMLQNRTMFRSAIHVLARGFVLLRNKVGVHPDDRGDHVLSIENAFMNVLDSMIRRDIESLEIDRSEDRSAGASPPLSETTSEDPS